ncbi:MAG: hypothetical protein EAX96_19060 [Candidatus Lokiarchaeota archaeon]|nr:hypothetical protein [Candidatus Lokiarchaeota archaeon]
MEEMNQFMTKIYEKMNESTEMLKELVEVMNRSSENIEKFNSLIEDKIVVLGDDIKGLNSYLKSEDEKYNKNLKETANRLEKEIKTLADFFNLKPLTDSLKNITAEFKTIDFNKINQEELNESINQIINHAKNLSKKIN